MNTSDLENVIRLTGAQARLNNLRKFVKLISINFQQLTELLGKYQIR